MTISYQSCRINHAGLNCCAATSQWVMFERCGDLKALPQNTFISMVDYIFWWTLKTEFWSMSSYSIAAAVHLTLSCQVCCYCNHAVDWKKSHWLMLSQNWEYGNYLYLNVFKLIQSTVSLSVAWHGLRDSNTCGVFSKIMCDWVMSVSI